MLPLALAHTVTLLSLSLSAGEVRVSLPDMDREVKGQYEVVIQAKDMAGQLGGLAGTTAVNVTLSDVNDNPPRFSQSENFSAHHNTQHIVFLRQHIPHKVPLFLLHHSNNCQQCSKVYIRPFTHFIG